MSEEENFTMQNLFAGVLTSVVEGKSLDEGLREVGLSEDYVISQWVAPQSSEGATDYVKDLMATQFGKISRDEGSKLYVVKKVLCRPDDYEAMAEAVSGADTDKFGVVRLIGSNQQVMGYKQENPGLEAYLASGKTPLEALRATNSENPIFNYNATLFDADTAKEFDGLVIDAVYKHNTEAVQKLFDAIGL